MEAHSSERGKVVYLKSIILSLFICSQAFAQFDTNAWSGAYWRVLPDGSPTLPQLIEDAKAATIERGEIIEQQYPDIISGPIPATSHILAPAYRSTMPYGNPWLGSPSFGNPSRTNGTLNTLEEIKESLWAYIPYTVDTNFVYGTTEYGAAGFVGNTATGICARLSIPTNYFDYTPPRYLDIPEAYMTNFPTNVSTQVGFTMADYGWHYIDDILLEMRYFNGIDFLDSITPEIESERYTIDSIITADNSDSYVNVVEGDPSTCRTDSGNTGSAITFANIGYSFITNSVVTNTSLNIYSLATASGASDLDSLSYNLNDGESLAQDTLTTDFTSPKTNTIATLTDNYTLTVTNDAWGINYNALFFVEYNAIAQTDDEFDMGDFSTLAISADPSTECDLHGISFDDLTVTNSYTTLPFYSEITTNGTFQLVGSNVFETGVSTEVSFTNSLGAYNPSVFIQSDTLEGVTGTYSGDTFTNSFDNSYFYDEIEIPNGASGNSSKSISDRKVILDFFTPGGFTYQ